MPQLDQLHHVVRAALERDGWRVTHDPLLLRSGSHNLYIDLGADRVLAVPSPVFESLLSSELGRTLREGFPLRLMVFEPLTAEVLQWIW